MSKGSGGGCGGSGGGDGKGSGAPGGWPSTTGMLFGGGRGTRYSLNIKNITNKIEL